MIIAGNVVIGIGLLFMLFGVFGIFRFKDFYKRILITGQIDTVGAMTVIVGIMLRQGLSFFSLKLMLIIAIMLILNPLATHITARSAHKSGHVADEATADDEGASK